MKMPDSYDSRFIRFLAAVLTPGAVAAWPWLIAFGLTQREIGAWLMQANALPYTVILLVTIVVGLLLEDAGSRLESALEKKILHKKAWTAYLRSEPDTKVGHAYISSVVTRLKFELAMPFALIIGALGCVAIAFHQGALTLCAAGILSATVSGIVAWLIFEATDSIKLLNKTRRRMFPPVDRSPTANTGNPPLCP